MKDFIKWLGVNEKAAKALVWLLIIMIFLITFNTGLESLGFPNYKITYDNLMKIDMNLMVNILSSCIMSILNFYAMILLVFRIKETKKIFKYVILYIITSWIVLEITNYAISQIFIIGYILAFCYLYSNKNKKYILYGIATIIVNVIVQGITYTYRMKFLDFDKLSDITQAILSIDYFIIMGIIILVKEIYLKKRGEKNA